MSTMTVNLPPVPVETSFDPADWDVLARYWHPVAWSHDVTDRPVAGSLLDVPLVIYRTTQGVVVAKDLCLHRGAPLTLGWMDGDEIVCAYHGFRYGRDGQCTLVPAHPDLKVSRKLRLATFRSIERYGTVWACLAEAAAGPLPSWEEADDPDYRKAHLEVEEWSASAARMIENFLDIAHFSWVHAGTFGNRDRPEMQPYQVERTPSGIHYEYTYLAANPDTSPLPDDRVIERRMVYDLVLPFAVRLVIHYPAGRRHAIMTAASPASAKRIRVFFFIARNFDHDKTADELLEWERRILAQDRAVVERQRPEELPLDLSQEFHIKADLASVAYRQGLRGLGLGRSFSA